MIQSLVVWFKESIFVKIFLGLLMISFGVWGVGNILSPGMDPNLAVKVGNADVSLTGLKRKFDADMERLTQASGGKHIDSPEMKRAVLDHAISDITYSATTD